MSIPSKDYFLLLPLGRALGLRPHWPGHGARGSVGPQGGLVGSLRAGLGQLLLPVQWDLHGSHTIFF